MLSPLDDVVGDVAAAVPRRRLPGDDAGVVGRFLGDDVFRRVRVVWKEGEMSWLGESWMLRKRTDGETGSI